MKVATGELRYETGQTIIREGEPGQEMYIIEEGEVDIVRGEGAAERRLGTLSAGDFFGEMSVIDDLPRGATARARTDCQVLAIDHSTFDQMLRRFPEVAIRMLRRMSARMRDSEAALEAARLQLLARPVTGETVSRATVLPLEAPSGGHPAAGPAEVEASLTRSGKRSWKLVCFETGVILILRNQAEIRVGRFDSLTGIRPDVDLTSIDHGKSTSRRHARIVREDERLFVFEEIGTANGTYVNGVRVGCNVKVEVKDGDQLQFGDVKTILKLDG